MKLPVAVAPPGLPAAPLLTRASAGLRGPPTIPPPQAAVIPLVTPGQLVSAAAPSRPLHSLRLCVWPYPYFRDAAGCGRLHASRSGGGGAASLPHRAPSDGTGRPPDRRPRPRPPLRRHQAARCQGAGGRMSDAVTRPRFCASLFLPVRVCPMLLCRRWSARQGGPLPGKCCLPAQAMLLHPPQKVPMFDPALPPPP